MWRGWGAESPMVTKVLEEQCVHNWVLASPNGSTSPGECVKCGERRRFANSFPDLERTNNSDLFGERSRRGPRGLDAYVESSDADIELALSSMRGGRWH